jgi:hypothetical protein
LGKGGNKPGKHPNINCLNFNYFFPSTFWALTLIYETLGRLLKKRALELFIFGELMLIKDCRIMLPNWKVMASREFTPNIVRAGIALQRERGDKGREIAKNIPNGTNLDPK